MNRFKDILITGGAGYVGAVLVPRLIALGYRVRVIDLYLFGDNLWNGLKGNPNLQEFKGDIRDHRLLKNAIEGCDAVIHLACISNDPSFELDPALGKSINFTAFEPLVGISQELGVRRFVYASTSSVYGISDASNVTEDHPLNPITDYSKFKRLCEDVLLRYQARNFEPVIIRPATVCGYSPRQRLDLTVNILTNHAVNTREIKVFGGSQLRPNIHIEDLVDLYVQLLEEPGSKIAGKTYNAGYQNHTVSEIAGMVRSVVKRKMPSIGEIRIVTTQTDDMRSYHISSERIKRELGFTPKRTVEDAVCDLVDAFREGKLPNSMTDRKYFNIKTMQDLVLK